MAYCMAPHSAAPHIVHVSSASCSCTLASNTKPHARAMLPACTYKTNSPPASTISDLHRVFTIGGAVAGTTPHDVGPPAANNNIRTHPAIDHTDSTETVWPWAACGKLCRSWSCICQDTCIADQTGAAVQAVSAASLILWACSLLLLSVLV